MRAAGRGHAKDAVALLEQSLARFREVDERRGIAIVLLDLAAAFASLERDEHRRRAALLEGLALLSELGDREGIARALDALASLSADQRR